MSCYSSVYSLLFIMHLTVFNTCVLLRDIFPMQKVLFSIKILCHKMSEFNTKPKLFCHYFIYLFILIFIIIFNCYYFKSFTIIVD